MERVWDYLMRRKGLLIAVLLLSAVGSFTLSRAFSQKHVIPDHTYITIASWGEDAAPEVEIPLTGAASPAPYFSVMAPRDLTQLTPPASNSDSSYINENDSADTSLSEVDPAEIALALRGSATTSPEPQDALVDAPAQAATAIHPALFALYAAALALLSYLTYQHFRR